MDIKQNWTATMNWIILQTLFKALYNVNHLANSGVMLALKCYGGTLGVFKLALHRKMSSFLSGLSDIFSSVGASDLHIFLL